MNAIEVCTREEQGDRRQVSQLPRQGVCRSREASTERAEGPVVPPMFKPYRGAPFDWSGLIKAASQDLEMARLRVRELESAIEILKDHRQRGDPFPGANERRALTLSSGFAR